MDTSRHAIYFPHRIQLSSVTGRGTGSPMKNQRRNYPAGTREALFVLSRGQCYAPDCRTPVMRRKGGQWQTTAHIAHICGLNKTSARFDDSIPVPERNNFGNLLLLCKPHHTQVD